MTIKEESAPVDEKPAKEKKPPVKRFEEFNIDILDTWFVYLEATFSVTGHFSDKYKFNALISCLGSRAKEFQKTIDRCGTLNTKKKYKILKAAVLEAYCKDGAPNRKPHPLSGIKVGDRKPSAALEEMRRLGVEGATDAILGNIWLRAVSLKIRQKVMSKAAATLDERAKEADKIVEARRLAKEARAKEKAAAKAAAKASTSTSVQESTSSSTKVTWGKSSESSDKFDFKDIIRRALEQVEQSRARKAASDVEEAPKPTYTYDFICWYHERHGTEALNCQKIDPYNPTRKCMYSLLK